MDLYKLNKSACLRNLTLFIPKRNIVNGNNERNSYNKCFILVFIIVSFLECIKREKEIDKKDPVSGSANFCR